MSQFRNLRRKSRRKSRIPRISLFKNNCINVLDVWLISQGEDLVDEVNRICPVKNKTDPGYYFRLPDYFNTTDPEIGAGFLFDAVMSIGFGACVARNESEPVTSSLDHLNGIRESDFQGSTGKVNFKDTSSTPGSRRSSGLTFGGYNLGVVDDETQEL